MKHLLFILSFTSYTYLYANPTVESSPINKTLIQAVERVENARKDTIKALNNMIHAVDKAREHTKIHNDSISTQIIETHALGVIAKGTASVEIAKAQALSIITQAMDKMNPEAMNVIADAIASVEVAKAKAAQDIVKATGRVEISKTKQPAKMKHPKETLTIAKNVSAIQIAKATAQAEVARAVSRIEIARSAMEASLPDALGQLTQKSKEHTEEVKAKATAKISSYLAQIEVLKAQVLTQIAAEVEKVEIAKIKAYGNNTSQEQQSTTYPKVLIRKD